MIENYILALLDWCKILYRLWHKASRVSFREGEVWWCSVGLNVGEEIYGKGPNFRRPVLVFKKLTKNSFLALPLTGSEKMGSWYVPIRLTGRKSSITLNQARIIDGKRLQRKIITLEGDDFRLIKETFHYFYCLE